VNLWRAPPIGRPQLAPDSAATPTSQHGPSAVAVRQGQHREPVINKTDTHQRLEDIKRLIHQTNHALQKLKEQQASFGPLHTPVHILLEIEEREAKLGNLQAELREIEAKSEPPTH
jgi:hypothetical protein